MAKNKKQEIEINPEIIDYTNQSQDFEELEKEMLNEEEGIELEEEYENNADSFFRAVVNNLMSPDNISMKTEYKNVQENFSGAKIEFLSKFANMPYMKTFLTSWELKRVSLERKGRIELIKALEKREQEIQQSKVDSLKNMFGVM